MDAFYTPPDLARKLINYIELNKIDSIADFCVGDGELLRAAQNKWINARFYATDIAENALIGVSKKHPDWQVSKCDFLSEESVEECQLLKKLKVDLILLNPPFSCLSSKKYEVKLGDETFFCSTAISFIVKALSFLKNDGLIYAILPCSVAYSEKDKKIWNKLVNDYKLRVIDSSDKKHFANCSPKILLVSINDSRNKCILNDKITISSNIDDIEVFRGKISSNHFNKLLAGKYPLVHTTNLQNNQIRITSGLYSNPSSQITGPAVLFPRVGNIRKDKIVVLKSKKTVLLSDCVIALKVKEISEARKLMKEVISHWDDFLYLYQGTGARYVTISKIKTFFNIKN